MKKEKKKAICKCSYCGEEFEQNRPHQKYCCGKCRFYAWEEKHPRIRLEEM